MMSQQATDDEKKKKKYNIALIGSSGGGTATLGHTDPTDFIQILRRETESLHHGGEEDNSIVSLKTVIFVALSNTSKGMDSASEDKDDATLYYSTSLIQEDRFVLKTKTGTLKEINQYIAEQLDAGLSKCIQLNHIHGLISVSCKPTLFESTLQQVSMKKLPVVGTGGTSLSQLSSKYHIKLIGNSGGSVATTPIVKAISFASAFSNEWNLSYAPSSSSYATNTTTNQEDQNRHNTATTTENMKQFPGWRSVLNSCLPAFWAIVLFKKLLTTPSVLQEWVNSSSSSTDLISMIEDYALPLICSVVMASQYSTNSNSNSPISVGALIGSIVAGCACQRTVLGGLIAGWMVSILEEYVLHFLILHVNTPATMTNLISTGLVGIVVATIMVPMARLLSTGSDFFRNTIVYTLAEPRLDDAVEEMIRTAALCGLGTVFCFGSKIGWYHSIFLPMILVEMERGDASFLGTIDFLTLVLVSAGICAGVICSKRQDGDGIDNTSLMKRGLVINLLCGDFIEVCYPIMEESFAINISGYVASSVSTGLLSNGCKSSAYLPFPISIWLADDWKRVSLACCCAFGIPFIVTVVAPLWRNIRPPSQT